MAASAAFCIAYPRSRESCHKGFTPWKKSRDRHVIFDAQLSLPGLTSTREERMHSHFTRTWRTKIAAAASAAVLSAFALIASVQAADPNTPVDAIKTATPIKHVIIIVGENRSFDHLFATYLPRHEEAGILDLRPESILTTAG